MHLRYKDQSIINNIYKSDRCLFLKASEIHSTLCGHEACDVLP
jgi:hypothetical protein